MADSNREPKWWESTTIYQIYPRSFQDSNGDGIGDLRGIISRLDYIQGIGFETLWISPFFNSPQRDFGYDVSDYYSVDKEYGEMSDVEALIAEAHARGMRIVLDMVMNHTSEEHAWFKESRSSQSNPKRDWYIWKSGRGSAPPNNWKSMIGTPGWNYDNTSDQWYYTNFLPFQPDLNYYNPEVKKAMFDVVRFWMEKGVDGFRLDIFNSIFKDASFKDNPFTFKYIPSSEDNSRAFFQKKVYTLNHPDSIALAVELRSLVDSYEGDRFLLGEVSGDLPTIRRYLGESQDGLNLVFLFELVNFRFTATFFDSILRKFESYFPHPYLPTYVFGNHDVPRCGSKIGYDSEKAKLLALFQLTARGVPIIYNGEEIGARQANIPLSRGKDPIAQMNRRIPKRLASALGLFLNRDDCRTPMRWDETPHAGFCVESDPWLPVNEDFAEVNVKNQLSDDTSLLNTYKKLLLLRKTNKALRVGELRLPEARKPRKDILIYSRHHADQEIVVVSNFGSKSRRVSMSDRCERVLFQTDTECECQKGMIRLPPLSGMVLGRDREG